MLRAQLRSGVAQVGLALREPEEFTRRWHGGDVPYSWWVFLALGLTAVLGTSTYGLTMGLLGGPGDIFLDALRCTTAAGLAWGIALPSLYIFNSLSGSKLRPSTTLLAALVTTSWGGLAMIASIPINWFFTVAFHDLVGNPSARHLAGACGQSCRVHRRRHFDGRHLRPCHGGARAGAWPMARSVASRCHGDRRGAVLRVRTVSVRIQRLMETLVETLVPKVQEFSNANDDNRPAGYRDMDSRLGLTKRVQPRRPSWSS